MSVVFSNSVAVNQGRPQQFDPHRMPEAVQKPAPVNTRTFLYHADPTKDKNGEGIIVEGKGETDQERIADFQARLAEKKKLGWSTERQQHGTHPHSNDTHRIEMQTLAVDHGDDKAKAALNAKAARNVVQLTSQELKIENELQNERIMRLEAELEALKVKAESKRSKREEVNA